MVSRRIKPFYLLLIFNKLLPYFSVEMMKVNDAAMAAAASAAAALPTIQESEEHGQILCCFVA